MRRALPIPLRFGLALVLVLLAALPARAQLDPKLQAGSADFLDLFQQSSINLPKPEIVSVFDFSRSMASLMFHPLYQNQDTTDADDYRYMLFYYTPASGGVQPNNSWQISATSGNDVLASAQGTLTINADGTGTFVPVTPAGHCSQPSSGSGNGGCSSSFVRNTPFTLTIQAGASGNGSASASIQFTPVSNSSTVGANDHTKYTAGASTSTGAQGSSPGTFTVSPISVSPSGPYAPGSTVTLTATLTHVMAEGEASINAAVYWSADWVILGSPTATQLGPGTFQSQVTFQVPDFVHFTYNATDYTKLAPIQVALASSPSTPIASGATIPAGSQLIFQTYFATQGTGTGNNKIVWSTTPGTANTCPGGLPSALGTTTAGTTLSSATSINATLPAYCTNAISGGTAAGVTVALDASTGANYDSGVTRPWLSGTTSAPAPYEALRKPDGTAVTAADANQSSGLAGSSFGSADVRNWIRAASHVRLKDAATGRTIDIPIPWKVMDQGSSGVPLSSATILDRQIKGAATYGSGQQVEFDTCYKYEGVTYGVLTSDLAGAGLTGSSSYAQTHCYLYGVAYRPAYLAWLYNGKYQNTKPTAPNYTTDSSLAGSYIAFDAVTASLVKNQGSVTWGQGFGPTGTWGQIRVPICNQDGSYAGVVYDEASNYRVPALTRLQAIKKAHLQSWVAHQGDVYWAFRCLDAASEAGVGTATTIDDNSTTTLASAPSTGRLDGVDSGWPLLNNTAAQGPTSTTGNSALGMARIARLFPSGDTALTYAMARTLAQFSDPNSVFNTVEGTNVAQCGKHFLLLFTDGIDNNGNVSLGNNANLTTPYVTGTLGSETFNALQGNQVLLSNPNLVNRSGQYWNLFTMAGAAAHLADPSLGTSSTVYLAALDPGTIARTGTPSSFLPFALRKRNGIAYSQDHLVTTMTVGVSLAGHYTDASSPKRSLFLAAITGRPGLSTGALSSYHPFVGWDQPYGQTSASNDWVPDPIAPTEYPARGVARDSSVYYFDATNPDRLTSSIEYAFRIAIAAVGNQATAAPTLPFVGASLGQQFYTGQFYPPSYGGVLWPGDLLSFATQEVNGAIRILDRSGAATSTLSAGTAIWSASSALLNGPVGTARTLYTRIPGATTLQAFTDSGDAFNHANTGLKNYVATSVSATSSAGLAQKQSIIQHAAGADITQLASSGKPTANRATIMGDVINSAPATLEYSWSSVSPSLSSYSNLSAVGGSRFRLILVGTNQGWLHAFGEVTKTGTNGLVTGAVQELWSFMPTDFLSRLDYLTVSSNTHRFMVDGSPTLYHLDLPPAGGGSGNGVVDSGELAVAVFGLGKGGRSYYALDVSNPFAPTLRWALVPDEAATFPAARIGSGAPSLATVQGLLGKFGFSTCPPGIGRVLDADGKLRDAVFLGGGFSTPDVEANFLDASSKPTPLGRSVVALDVSSGSVLAALDLTSDAAAAGTPAIGPVGSGLVPFEFILNSGLTQRAYFLDYRGGLWAWGSKQVATAAPFTNFRMDSSKLSDWALRKVYRDDNANKGARYTTPPAPFRVGLFPGATSSATSAIPAAVGIAMVSGDRNNPLDRAYTTANPTPTQHRLTVVFDRQDSYALGLNSISGTDAGIASSQLKDFTGNTVSTTPTDPCSDSVLKLITPGCSSYYLAQSNVFGYCVSFPAAASGTGFVPKGINPPLVVAGSLYYAYFTPTSSDPCQGGTGNTSSWLIRDVMNPIVTDNRTGLSSPSGLKQTWSGVASDFIPMGTQGAIQGGMVPSGSQASQDGSSTAAQLVTISGNPAQRFARPRVWRTVH